MNGIYIPSRGLTYPTWGKGKSSSKCHFWGICLFPRGYTYIAKVGGDKYNLGNWTECRYESFEYIKTPWENNEVKTSQQKKDLELNKKNLVHPWRFIKIYYTKAFKKIFERMYFFSTSIFTIRSSILQSVNTYHFMSVLKSRKKSGPKAEYITLKMGPNQVINGIVTP